LYFLCPTVRRHPHGSHAQRGCASAGGCVADDTSAKFESVIGSIYLDLLSSHSARLFWFAFGARWFKAHHLTSFDLLNAFLLSTTRWRRLQTTLRYHTSGRQYRLSNRRCANTSRTTSSTRTLTHLIGTRRNGNTSEQRYRM